MHNVTYNVSDSSHILHWELLISVMDHPRRNTLTMHIMQFVQGLGCKRIIYNVTYNIGDL